MKANIPALGLVAAGLAAGLAACGGGLLAVLQIVTPLGGQWSGGGNTLQFTSLRPLTQVFLSKFDVTVDLNTASPGTGICGVTNVQTVALVGTVDNGAVELRRDEPNAPICLRGTFSDLRKLDVAAPGGQFASSYTNTRVDIQLQIGLWVSENGALSLKFNEALAGDEDPTNVNNNSTTKVSGCNVSNRQAKVNFEGEMQGFNTTTLRRPYFEKLTGVGGTPIFFTQVEFVDGATLRLLNATGQLVTLKRQPDPTNLTC